MLALLLQVAEVPVEKRTECRLELRREADAEVAAPLPAAPQQTVRSCEGSLRPFWFVE